MVLGPGKIVPAALRLYQLSGGAGFAEEAQHFRCWFHIQHVYTTAERARHGLQVGRPGLVTHRAVNKRGAGIADMQFVQRSIEAALIIKQLLHWTTEEPSGPQITSSIAALSRTLRVITCSVAAPSQND